MNDPRFDGVVRTSPGDPALREALLPVRHPGDSHAANLLELDDGDLLCAWFNGPEEGDPGTDIVLSRLSRGGERWSQPLPLAQDPERSEQNPVLAQDAEGTVWLFHPSNTPHDQKTARLIVRTSRDRGKTWSEPRVLFEGPGIFVRNPPLFLPDGSWLLPAYWCRPGGEHSTVMISQDGGGTWREHDLPDSDHLVQMTAVQRADGSLFAMFRSRAADRIHASESFDQGRTWQPLTRTELPNNNSAVQLTRLAGGALALLYNDATLERDQFRWVGEGAGRRKKALRTPLTLALSEDGGRTWPYRRDVQTADEEYRDSQLGYSYPSIVQTRDGALHLAYSFLRKTIKYVRLDEDWVRAAAPGPGKGRS
ncbi:sialidase family protein [Streptomyces johnsoniae]|uniref:Sialidase family protein n=1 Tax=Streptomyces johnsoniae TaxID=3075532 RepID=A0ABU2S734_9ACTN|nr:sialidase family protein [Streptomyces sp. DSM 41886]MDT0444730.1 sialidase family protein [Streptomyces sp. DSM 41886]